MIIWVKELADVLTVNGISGWIKDNMELRAFLTIDDVKIEDFIIISKLDSFTESIAHVNTIIYEEVFGQVSANIIEEYGNNKDFYFLKNALAYAKESSVNTRVCESFSVN